MATSPKQAKHEQGGNIVEEEEGTYTVYYWEPSILQGGAGRSEYIKVLLEEAAVPYRMEHGQIYEQFAGPDKTWTGYPAFAVPLIQKGNFSLSQTGVVCRYLGKKHGLYPSNEVDEWHADQINATVHDYIGEGRLAFHGKEWTGSYLSQQEETKPYIEYFLKERMPKFLKHFEKALEANSGGKGFVVGDALSYVDLALWNALRVTASQFPGPWDSLRDSLPLLHAFLERLAQRPRLKAYLASPRSLPFSGNSMM